MKSHFDTLQALIEGKLIAIARLDSGDELINVAAALKAGGISSIEFTVPTPNALDMIKQARAHFGEEVIMGAGTVLDPETARAAILAGAQFIVTPTLNLGTIELCKRHGIPVVSGALTPTEILDCLAGGRGYGQGVPGQFGWPAIYQIGPGALAAGAAGAHRGRKRRQRR